MSAIDGLISGMDTTSLIKQLMQLERMPSVRLQNKKTMADKAIAALQGLNTKFLAIADLAKKLGATSWELGGTTSSHPTILAAQSAPGTAPTTLSVTVKSLATAHKIQSAGSYAAITDKVADKDDPITFNYLDTNGAATSVTITRPHDGSLQGVADAINASSTAPASAAVVFDGTGYRLELTAKRSGAFSGFSVTGLQRGTAPGMTFATVAAAADAEVTVGSGDFAKTLKSTTNIMEIAEGIEISLKTADPLTAVTVAVVAASKPADDVEKLVAAANEFLKEAKTLTAYGTGKTAGGVLAGNSDVRDLQRAVLEAVSGATGGTNAATAGVQLTRDGLITFDKTKFDAAYLADPVGVQALFTGPVGSEGIAQRLAAVSETATRSTTGLLVMQIDARRSEIKRIDDSLASWDVRLVRREATLRRQFAALETALGAAQQQSNWLASQLASLPTTSA